MGRSGTSNADLMIALITSGLILYMLYFAVSDYSKSITKTLIIDECNVLINDFKIWINGTTSFTGFGNNNINTKTVI